MRAQNHHDKQKSRYMSRRRSQQCVNVLDIKLIEFLIDQIQILSLPEEVPVRREPTMEIISSSDTDSKKMELG